MSRSHSLRLTSHLLVMLCPHHVHITQFDAALEWYDKATRLHPSYAEAHCNVGVILKVREHWATLCKACLRHTLVRALTL